MKEIPYLIHTTKNKNLLHYSNPNIINSASVLNIQQNSSNIFNKFENLNKSYIKSGSKTSFILKIYSPSIITNLIIVSESKLYFKYKISYKGKFFSKYTLLSINSSKNLLDNIENDNIYYVNSKGYSSCINTGKHNKYVTNYIKIKVCGTTNLDNIDFGLKIKGYECKICENNCRKSKKFKKYENYAINRIIDNYFVFDKMFKSKKLDNNLFSEDFRLKFKEYVIKEYYNKILEESVLYFEGKNLNEHKNIINKDEILNSVHITSLNSTIPISPTILYSKDKLYVLGGIIKNNPTNDFYEIDIIKGTVKPLNKKIKINDEEIELPEITKFSNKSIILENGNIFYLNTFVKNLYLCIYIIEKDCWLNFLLKENVSSINGCSLVYKHNNIYIIGGKFCDGITGKSYNNKVTKIIISEVNSIDNGEINIESVKDIIISNNIKKEISCASLENALYSNLNLNSNNSNSIIDMTCDIYYDNFIDLHYTTSLKFGKNYSIKELQNKFAFIGGRNSMKINNNKIIIYCIDNNEIIKVINFPNSKNFLVDNENLSNNKEDFCIDCFNNSKRSGIDMNKIQFINFNLMYDSLLLIIHVEKIVEVWEFMFLTEKWNIYDINCNSDINNSLIDVQESIFCFKDSKSEMNTYNNIEDKKIKSFEFYKLSQTEITTFKFKIIKSKDLTDPIFINSFKKFLIVKILKKLKSDFKKIEVLKMYKEYFTEIEINYLLEYIFK